MQVLADYREPDRGRVRCVAQRSWLLGQFAPVGMYLSGYDIIDTFCALYELQPRGTFRFFEQMMEEPDWLGLRFDRWPQATQRQFGHAAFLVPAFDVYLLDVTPVLPSADFYRRWRDLFRARIAGKTAIVASGGHRAALQDFPGRRLHLASGMLRAPLVAAPSLAVGA
jgi:hypothetical protein